MYCIQHEHDNTQQQEEQECAADISHTAAQTHRHCKEHISNVLGVAGSASEPHQSKCACQTQCTGYAVPDDEDDYGDDGRQHGHGQHIALGVAGLPVGEYVDQADEKAQQGGTENTGEKFSDGHGGCGENGLDSKNVFRHKSLRSYLLRFCFGYTACKQCRT